MMFRKVIMLLMLPLLLPATNDPAATDVAYLVGSPPPQGYGVSLKGRVTVILAPRRQAMLSAEVSERVSAIHKRLGEQFAVGQPLLQIDDTIFQINKRIAAANLAAAKSAFDRVKKLAADGTRRRHAEAVLAAAQANLVATQHLYDDKHASRLDLENAKRDATIAETKRELVAAAEAKELTKATRELAIAVAESDIAEQQLEACTIAAPWSGRVARLLIHEHELVDRGTQVIEVIDDRMLVAKFLLPSAVFQSIRVGQELHLAVKETSATLIMKVSHIAAALDPASETFEVHAEVENTAGNLRAGMNGTFRLAEIEDP